ncbi:MAG: SpoIID/LytB domain-containing protein, partial [Elusimicrobia bacterium]|nr:SpoIID/LytB domain-containing protein [Elusimicrobiota bacterium]
MSAPAGAPRARAADAPAEAETIFNSRRRALAEAAIIIATSFAPFSRLHAASPAKARKLIARANHLYFQGRYQDAVADYRRAAELDRANPQPWLDGGEIFNEIQKPQSARQWFSRAAAVDPSSDVLTALGWSQFETRRYAAAQESFERALEKNSGEAYAWVGMARVDNALSRPGTALRDLDNAEKSAPFLNLIPYYRAGIYEKLDEKSAAAKALKQSIIADSYFQEARRALARLYLSEHRYNLAWREVAYIVNAEPHNRLLLGLLRRLQPLITLRPAKILGIAALAVPPKVAKAFPKSPRMPFVRVGIGTDALGRPRPRDILIVGSNARFAVETERRGKLLFNGEAGKTWTILLRRLHRRLRLELRGPAGSRVYLLRGPVLIRPLSISRGVVVLNDAATVGPRLSNETLRGTVEISIFHGSLRIINIVNVESYVAGVLAAEMPIDSPIEALKAQAILARTEALYLKTVLRPHRKGGYDLCDSQHCQVYEGARAENARARAVVKATRGEVVYYKGRLAQVTYSADCGGHTQSAKEVSGWGNIPYWKGVSDMPDGAPPPDSPWALREWLFSWPKAYGGPSLYVAPSHFRWTRVVPFREISDRLDAHYHIGRLKRLIVLRRAPSGNVNSVLAMGTRRNARIDSESDIRYLLALGSLRSTLFVTEADYDAEGRPIDLIFHGGGWGHGVGLCQSGAIGRALAGQ